jgi:hypothetical protein
VVLILRLRLRTHFKTRHTTGIHHSESRTDGAVGEVADFLAPDFEDTTTLSTTSASECISKNDDYSTCDCCIGCDGRLVVIGCALDVVLKSLELAFKLSSRDFWIRLSHY